MSAQGAAQTDLHVVYSLGLAQADLCVRRHGLCVMGARPQGILSNKWNSEPLGGPGWHVAGSNLGWAGKNRTPHIPVDRVCSSPEPATLWI